MARRYEIWIQADVVMSMLREEVISGRAVLTALVSKGVEKELRDVVNSTFHLCEGRSEVDDKRIPYHLVDAIFLSIMFSLRP